MENIISEITRFTNKYGGKYSDWYIGITSKQKAKLFQIHNINEYLDKWIYEPARNNKQARNIKSYLIILGLDGEEHNDDDDDSARFVYAYKKTQHTIQSPTNTYNDPPYKAH